MAAVPLVQIDRATSIKEASRTAFTDDYLRLPTPTADAQTSVTPVVIGFGHEDETLPAYPWGYKSGRRPLRGRMADTLVGRCPRGGAQKRSPDGRSQAVSPVPGQSPPVRRCAQLRKRVRHRRITYSPSDNFAASPERPSRSADRSQQSGVLSEIAVGPAAGQFSSPRSRTVPRDGQV